jgi:hypothetical protein
MTINFPITAHLNKNCFLLDLLANKTIVGVDTFIVVVVFL